ncbi:MAG: TMEM175 family protein [Ferruginibacter sp.]
MNSAQIEKNLELERLVFFSDAVVAIAITLLVFNLKIEKAVASHLTFADIGNSWKMFVSFFLSFLIIAIFWRIHHQFFFFIKKVNQRLLFYNMGWLLFIVILPFSTTLVSANFFDTPAVFLYSTNILLITCLQNLIWDYVSVRPEFLKDLLSEKNKQGIQDSL